MNEPHNIGEVLKKVRRAGEQGSGAGEGGVSTSSASKNPVVLRLERIATDRLPWSSDGPTCPKCGLPWGTLVSEQFDAWCAQCALEHPEEYKPVFRAWVIEHRARYFERAGVPLRFRDCWLGNFQARTRDQQRALEALTAWASAGCSAGLYIHGPVGTGKTHLACAALLELMARRHRAHFTSVRELLLRCRESFRVNERLSHILDECSGTGALLLDDLGAEKYSEFGREVFDVLIDRAYVHCEPRLVCTSNMDLDALSRKLDPRISDRIGQLCLAVNTSGASFRRRIAAHREGRGT